MMALLAACGGGSNGSSVTVSPPGPTPTPNAQLVGLADGAEATYDRTEAAAITVTTIGGGVGLAPTPAPNPTTTIALTYRDDVTVSGNQTFGGTSGLYDVRTSVTPTSSSEQSYSSYSNVVDAYEGAIATPTGFALVAYGSIVKQSTTSNYVAAESSSVTLSSTNTVPLRLAQVPAGAPFDPVLAYTETATSQFTTVSAPGTNSGGPSSISGTGTFVLGADGSLHESSTDTGNDGSVGTYDETITGPGLAGTQTITQKRPSFPPSSATVTIGSPTAAGGGYTVAFGETFAGTNPPQPLATTVPLWYPDGPNQRPFTVHLIGHGLLAVPTSCALPAGLPSSGEATETARSSVSPFDGAVDQVDETRWDAPTIGTLCSIATETYSTFDPTTGTKLGSSYATTTRALRATTVPAEWRRRASAGGTNALPFVLPPAQPRLAQLVDALRRRARTAATKHR